MGNKLDPCALCADTFVKTDVTDPQPNKKVCQSCGYNNSQNAQNS